MTVLRTGVRKRRTRAELAALDDQIVAVLEGDHPQSVRHCFYVMTDPTGPVSVEKTEQGYRSIVRRCTVLRRSGRVPYHWLTDATRRGHHVATFVDGGELIGAFAGLYRVNIWMSAATYVEVWCESRSIAGVIQSDCRRLGVSLYPCGGFASLSLTWQAAEGIKKAARGRPVRIIYAGDFDPAGVLIDKSVIKELRSHLPGTDIRPIRIAITAEQAARLPSKPRKEEDNREPDILETVECEAMPAAELRGLLTKAIEQFIPAGALAAARVVEQSEREGLKALGNLVKRDGLETVLNQLGDVI